MLVFSLPDVPFLTVAIYKTLLTVRYPPITSGGSEPVNRASKSAEYALAPSAKCMPQHNMSRVLTCILRSSDSWSDGQGTYLNVGITFQTEYMPNRLTDNGAWWQFRWGRGAVGQSVYSGLDDRCSIPADVWFLVAFAFSRVRIFPRRCY